MKKYSFKEIDKKCNKMKEAIAKEIESLPQNARIKSICKNCFIINTVDIDIRESLSPNYYNFKLSYKKVADAVRRSDFSAIPFMLERIICQPSAYKLHPEQIVNLDKILSKLK